MDYTEDEVLEILKDDSRIDEFLSSLTGDDLKKYLIYVNSKVRNVPYAKNEICSQTMVAGSLVSPNNEIQNRYFDKMANALSNVQGRKNKATMMYYLINELHLFEDGNGRTSRAVFEMLNNRDFSFENNDNFAHTACEIIGETAKVNNSDFEIQNNVTGSMGVEIYANYYLYKALIQKGIIPSTEDYTKKIIVMTDAGALLETSLNDDSTTLNNPVYIPDEINQQLSQAQIEQIQNALADNNGALVTTSGLTMLTMLLNNESTKDIKDFSYADGQMFSFPLDNNNDDKDRILGKWQKEDFFKAINIANLLKENMLDMIVDFFEYPENFIVEGQLNMREALTTKSEIIDEQDYTVLETLQKTASLDINGTQTAKNMEQLVSLLQQMSIQNDSVINCENIGKQVIIEMSDVTLEDETEQGIISNEKDIQNDIENNTNEQQL